MEIDIKIDELTNCLIEQSTGKKFDTEYRLMEKDKFREINQFKKCWLEF